jgi:hypothetical protein
MVEPERTRVLTSFGAFPVLAERLWQMVREAQLPPMGGEPRWVVEWGAFEQAFESRDPVTIGFERAEFYRAMLICRNIENSDPKGWPEISFGERAPFTQLDADA